MNPVADNRDELEPRNYVLNPRRDSEYWCQYHYGKLRGLEKKFGDDFYLITDATPEIDRDYYVIPFAKVKSAFSDANLAKSGKKRWITKIVDGILRINNTDGFDIRGYHGNFALLEKAMGRRVYLDSNEAMDEEAEEQPFNPRSGDWRELAFRQIKLRRGQQKFRNALIRRYGKSCMISRCQLLDVVEAAHIKPYHGENDNNAANGLLLRADIHTLFDLDLIGIEPETLTVRVHTDAILAGYGQFDKVKLACSGKRPNPGAMKLRWKDWRGHSG